MLKHWGLLVLAQLISLSASAAAPEFSIRRQPLGDYSSLLYTYFFQQANPVEGQSEAHTCYFEFAIPLSPRVKEWVHPASLVCPVDGTEHLRPLGNIELRKSNQNNKWLMRGEGIVLLTEALKSMASDSDVESPIATRHLGWGPGNELLIFTLRQSADIGNLKAGLECYEHIPQGGISCSLSF